MADASSENSLHRSMNLLVLRFYGLGTIIGAGIYVLIGEVAGLAGSFMPLSFIVAGLIALFTGLSYCELSSRFPYCAGVAIYADKAWQFNWLSGLSGWMMVLTGIVSAAAIANGFAAYLAVFVDLPRHWAIVILCFALCATALYGIKLSATAVFLITLIELTGLAYVVWICAGMEAVDMASAVSEGVAEFSWQGVLLGSFLAFYAFIGFEDMVNVVEEVKSPRRNMPLGIILSIALATLAYVIVTFMVLRVSTPQELSASSAPLADLVERGGQDAGFIGAISLLAVINGALVQIIMASRVLYGMARMHLVSSSLAVINSMTKTPVLATVMVSLLVLVFALLLPLDSLARLTSAIMLLVFIIVNFALLRIKRRDEAGESFIRLPQWVPMLGVISSMALLVYQLWYLF